VKWGVVGRETFYRRIFSCPFGFYPRLLSELEINNKRVSKWKMDRKAFLEEDFPVFLPHSADYPNVAAVRTITEKVIPIEENKESKSI
jgi:hypothetical protein